MLTLGSSNGFIQVEAVGLDKIRRNLSKLDRLRVIGLDSCSVSSVDQVSSSITAMPSWLSHAPALRISSLCRRYITRFIQKPTLHLAGRGRNTDPCTQLRDLDPQVHILNLSCILRPKLNLCAVGIAWPVSLSLSLLSYLVVC
jgi:hypothetical protein